MKYLELWRKDPEFDTTRRKVSERSYQSKVLDAPFFQGKNSGLLKKSVAFSR